MTRSRLFALCAAITLAGSCAELEDESFGDSDDKADAVVPATWLWPGGDVYLQLEADFWELDVSAAMANAAEELAANTGIRIHFIDDPSESPHGLYTTIEAQFGWFVGGSAPIGAHEGARGTTGGISVRHELGHVLGLTHTQQRADRDENVTIHWKYIEKGFESNFKKASYANLVGPYDLGSIMHYGSSLGTTDSDCATISPKSYGYAADDCARDTNETPWRTNVHAYSDWNFNVLAVVYCDERFCKDKCAPSDRCEAPAVKARLETYRQWELSPEGIDLKDRYSENVP